LHIREAGMPSTHLTLMCDDIAAGATFFRDVLSLPVRQRDPHHVDVELGRCTATLTPRGTDPDSGRPTQEPAVILEVEVTDVREAVRDLRRRGATVLLGPVVTEWDTESAFVAGPDGVVVELYRQRERERRPLPQS
jgi:catechol 2,3-dioxygenase-like lactoylglutathione lyase family enzyme